MSKEVLLNWYGPALATQTDRLKADIATAVTEHGHGLSTALSGGGDLERLETDYHRLKNLARLPT